ncbi:MAG: hypothetical protein H7250_09570 [Flavobacterium sp.]|nr:hypothetical protein [Flavobacterium sp.]
MKIYALILLTVFLSKGCGSDEQVDMQSAVVEYTATTRGFFQKITIKNNEVFVSKERNSSGIEKGTKISDTDWKEMVKDFQAINLDEIKNLKSPTEKRFYDGAPIANLKITFKDKTYESQSFDHGFPPAEIEKLVVKINSLVKTK